MKGKSLVIVVVALLLLGFGGYFVMSGKNSSKSGDLMKDESTKQDVGGSKQNTLKGLFMAGIPQSCTFSSEVEGYKSEGTVYTAKGKMRGDFSSIVGDREMKSHMIVDGETSYIWTDGETKGFKASFTKEQQEAAEESIKDLPKPTGGVDLEQMADYDCKPWLANGSYFELPSGIEFASLEDMMGDIQKQIGSQCAACDELTGDSKTQCLTMLKCD